MLIKKLNLELLPFYNRIMTNTDAISALTYQIIIAFEGGRNFWCCIGFFTKSMYINAFEPLMLQDILFSKATKSFAWILLQ